jgi:hypothetical protein
MKSTLYTGVPGCGKTFRAIAEATSFVIAVPCRQLAYEIYWDYPKQISRIDTGEVHTGDSDGNQVCVYENLPARVIRQESLIVDEAHYLNDPERGGALFEKITLNRAAGKKIVLLTATDTLSDEVRAELEVEEVELQPFASVPTKIEVGFEEFCDKVKAGMSAIVFTKYMPSEDDVDYYAEVFGIEASNFGVLSAQTPTFERVEAQLKFKTGKLQVVIATNVLAQGLNFPAQGVMIEYNEWDDWEIVSQKVGRVARPLFGINEGYYCLSEMPSKYKKRGLPQNVEREANRYRRPSGVELDIAGWGFMPHEVPYNLDAYKSFKYAYRFLRTLREKAGILESEEQAALTFLEEQSAKLCDLLAKRGLGTF